MLKSRNICENSKWPLILTGRHAVQSASPYLPPTLQMNQFHQMIQTLVKHLHDYAVTLGHFDYYNTEPEAQAVAPTVFVLVHNTNPETLARHVMVSGLGRGILR